MLCFENHDYYYRPFNSYILYISTVVLNVLSYGISYLLPLQYYGKLKGLKQHVNYFTVSMGDGFTEPFALGAHKTEAKVLAGLPPHIKAGRGGCGLLGAYAVWAELSSLQL